MPTKQLKDFVGAHFSTLFAAEITAGSVTVTALRNLEDPSPPRREEDIDGKIHIFLAFPPTRQEGAVLGAGGPWDERGAFMVHIASASGSGEALADEIAEMAAESLRDASLGGAVDIHDIIEADAGPKWGGNFWGISLAVSFHQPGIPRGV